MRDDERCGRSKEVRIPELIGQIKNFMDKDRRVSIETISAQFDVSVGTGFPLDRQPTRKYYVEVLREFRKRFRRKRPALYKSGQWHFHPDNAPVLNSILVTYYLTKMGIKTVPQPPDSPDLAPVTFGYSLSSRKNLEAVVYETIEEMKEAVTKVIDTLTQEDFNGAFQKLLERYKQVHCSRRRLLRRGLEFHACTIYKSAHTKKVWKPI